ncbi:hypothetical protein N1851_033809 [Merluccius polli]|uniref:ubiquitinyl hydrolase 1 n=1 Tax=Merluccius polli TaxID=89951 RepID=A0AA47M0N3_MERPO|nr:hypothetical protein N1851_033809 [Merluccius polli]
MDMVEVFVLMPRPFSALRCDWLTSTCLAMPRGKSFRRSLAARRREAARADVELRIQSDEQPSSPSKRRLVRHQVDGCPVVLKECFVPLNPVMDAVVPAHLPSPDCPAVPQDTPVDATPSAVTMSLEPSSVGVSSSKKLKNSDYAEVNSDVFVADVSKGLQFKPLCGEVVETLCKQLNVDSEKVDLLCSEVGLLGAPCLKEKIIGDGNCFFRAVSQAVCGTHKHHRKIRLAIVKHLKANGGIFGSEYSSMEEYLTMSKMAYVGSMATEVEIQAAADFFGVSIFTYCDGRWLECSCKDRPFSCQGIYLENCNGNHYETVVCVQQPNMQCCYGYCKLVGEESHLFYAAMR